MIVDGQHGTVEDLSITYTIVKIWNWRPYVVPNSRMLAKEFVNCSINDSCQRKHVEFWVAYDADLEKVEDLAVQAVGKSRFAFDGAPSIPSHGPHFSATGNLDRNHSRHPPSRA